MLVEWTYIYKRRSWSIEKVYSFLPEKTWENFQKFHSDRGMTCPPKDSFKKLVQPPPPPAESPKVSTSKRKATPKKKETQSDTKRKTKSK